MLSPELTWLLIVAVMAIAVISCLRVIGFSYYNAVCWHNLKVEVHRLRAEQEDQLREVQGLGPLPSEPSEADAPAPLPGPTPAESPTAAAA